MNNDYFAGRMAAERHADYLREVAKDARAAEARAGTDLRTRLDRRLWAALATLPHRLDEHRPRHLLVPHHPRLAGHHR